MQENQGTSGKLSQRKRNITIGFWLGIFVILILVMVRGQSAKQAQTEANNAVLWDPQLLACNEVFDASPSEHFTTCLKMADEGWIDAAQRIAWAYSRDGEYQSWQKAYNWLNWLSRYDDYAELLAYMILFEIGEDTSVKEDGERGIRRMAVVNHPAASAYLASLYYLGIHQMPQQSNIAWLLERAYAKSKYWVMPEEMARIYARGFLGKPQVEKAKSLLMQAKSIDFPLHANNVAWLFATTSSDALSEPQIAIEFAKEVVEDEAYAENYTYVDTLAAAYAANGEFTKAINTQQEAITLLKREMSKQPNLEDQLATYSERLDLYQAEKAFTIDEPEVSGTRFFEDFKNDIEQALIEALYIEFEEPETFTDEERS